MGYLLIGFIIILSAIIYLANYIINMKIKEIGNKYISDFNKYTLDILSYIQEVGKKLMKNEKFYNTNYYELKNSIKEINSKINNLEYDYYNINKKIFEFEKIKSDISKIEEILCVR